MVVTCAALNYGNKHRSSHQHKPRMGLGADQQRAGTRLPRVVWSRHRRHGYGCFLVRVGTKYTPALAGGSLQEPTQPDRWMFCADLYVCGGGSWSPERRAVYSVRSSPRSTKWTTIPSGDSHESPTCK